MKGRKTTNKIYRTKLSDTCLTCWEVLLTCWWLVSADEECMGGNWGGGGGGVNSAAL